MAARKGNVDVLRYAFEENCPMILEFTVAREAILSGNVNCLALFLDNGGTIDLVQLGGLEIFLRFEYTLQLYGILQCFKLLYDSNFKWHSRWWPTKFLMKQFRSALDLDLHTCDKLPSQSLAYLYKLPPMHVINLDA